MQIISHNPQINFGWNGPTHKALSCEVFNENEFQLQQLNIYDIPKIAQASVLPDKEPHPMGSHSADIKKLKDGDAFSTFIEYDEKLNKLVAGGDKNSDKIIEYLGRIFHSIQDMTDPFHVIFNPNGSKTETMRHIAFEKEAEKNQQEAISIAKQQKPETTDFLVFLKDKMLEAKKFSNDVMRKTAQNSEEFKKIQIQTLINSYHVSNEYLKRFIIRCA